MKIKPQLAFLITLVIFIVGIAATSALGLYNTKTNKEPAKLDQAGYTNQNDPGDIRGSYTFSDISSLYGVALDDLSDAFGQSGSTSAATKCKDLATIYASSPEEIGTASMRMFVAFYLGLPYAPTEDTYLPDSAANILKEKGAMTVEQKSYLDAHITGTADDDRL